MKAFFLCALAVGAVFCVPVKEGSKVAPQSEVATDKRQGQAYPVAESRQDGFRDSYLEALEYSHNSGAVQGTDDENLGQRIIRFFRNLRGNSRVSRGAVAAAVGVPIATAAAAAMIFPFAAGKRKRRSADGVEEEIEASVSPMGLLAQRAAQIYNDVKSSDDCIERIACELGSYSKGFSYKDSVLRVANFFAPDNYRKYINRLTAASDREDEVDSCRTRLHCKAIGI